MVLTARDTGDLKGTTDVIITITDVNDNAPVFIDPPTPLDNSTPTQIVKVPETVEIGYLVYTVRAEDNDQKDTKNGQGTYKFQGINNDLVRSLFSINSTSGEIRTRGILDADSIDIHNIYISATDGGNDHKEVSCTITIEVLDQNYQAPVIIAQWLPNGNLQDENGYYLLPEDVAISTPLFYFSVTDADTNTINNGLDETTIDDTTHFELERKSDKNSYILRTKVNFDREEQEEYSITITAKDKGEPQLTQIENIKIKLTDVNDNNPTFKRPNYSFNIEENRPEGETVFDLKDLVIDNDAGENGTFSFSMRQTVPEHDMGTFRLENQNDPDTARIVLASVLDLDGQDKSNRYELVVTGKPTHCVAF